MYIQAGAKRTLQSGVVEQFDGSRWHVTHRPSHHTPAPPPNPKPTGNKRKQNAAQVQFWRRHRAIMQASK